MVPWIKRKIIDPLFPLCSYYFQVSVWLVNQRAGLVSRGENSTSFDPRFLLSSSSSKGCLLRKLACRSNQRANYLKCPVKLESSWNRRMNIYGLRMKIILLSPIKGNLQKKNRGSQLWDNNDFWSASALCHIIFIVSWSSFSKYQRIPGDNNC